MHLLSRANISKILRFVLIGVITTGLDVGVFYSTISLTDSIFFASTVSFVIAVVVNYLGHSFFTFKSGIGTENFVKYIVVLILQYFISLSLIVVFSWMLGNALMGKLTSLAIIVPLSFLLSNVYVYARNNQARPG